MHKKLHKDLYSKRNLQRKSLKPLNNKDKTSIIEDSEEVQEMPGYLNEAANVIKKAIECESEERFDESIACYRYFLKDLFYIPDLTKPP